LEKFLPLANEDQGFIVLGLLNIIFIILVFYPICTSFLLCRPKSMIYSKFPIYNEIFPKAHVPYNNNQQRKNKWQAIKIR